LITVTDGTAIAQWSIPQAEAAWSLYGMGMIHTLVIKREFRGLPRVHKSLNYGLGEQTCNIISYKKLGQNWVAETLHGLIHIVMTLLQPYHDK